jgi:hypothetical protein
MGVGSDAANQGLAISGFGGLLLNAQSNNIDFITGTAGTTDTNLKARITAAGLVGIGTSTPKFLLQLASSTVAQLALSDGSLTNAPFNLRAINNSLYLSTSSPTTFATTSSALLTFDSSTGSTTLLKLDVAGTATSSFNNGINLAAGCVSVSGTCLTSNAGTVTSVNASGGTTGLSFSGGPVTSSGTLTLAGTLGAANGGTGSTTLSGILVGNGASAVNTLTLPSFLSLAGSTLSLNGALGIANGGTGTTTQITNGINYFDGTRITSNTNFTFDGANLSIPTNGWLATGGNFFAYASSTGRATLFGIGAGGQNATTTGVDVTAFGFQALNSNTTGFDNVGIGVGALRHNTSGSANEGIGFAALSGNLTGGSNIAIGEFALTANQTGFANLAFGTNAIPNNQNGSGNIGLGASALLSAASSYNIGIGDTAGSSINGGFGNIILGSNPDGVTSITTGANNIGIGYGVAFPSATANNQLNIGNFIYGIIPATTTAFKLPTSGALGIGTSSPYAKLSIATNNGDTATTLFAIGSSTASATTTLFSISNTGALAQLGGATSTFSNGLNITAGCYAVNGTCLSSGGSGTVAAIGPAGQTQTGPTITFASTTSTTNGLTSALTITGSSNTLTFAPALSGTLTVAGGGTGLSSVGDGQLLYGGTGSSLTALATSTGGFLTNSYSTGRPIWSATSTLNLGISGGGTGTTSPGVTNGVEFYNGTALTNDAGFTYTGNNGTLGLNALLNITGNSQTLNFAGVSTLTRNTSTGALTINANNSIILTPSTGFVGIGTSTPEFPLQLAASAAPQLTLSDGSLTSAPFNFRSINSKLYISTSSPTTFATTSTAFLAFDSSTGSTTLSKLDVTGTATSSFSNGLNLTAGCFAVNGTCLTSGGAGTVTSVDASGGTTGLTFSGGPITNSGTLTLAGTLGIANGGTGTTTQITNGINYFDGTNITSNTEFTFNATNGQLAIPSDGGYLVGGNLFAYGSTTNRATLLGIGAGGQNATTSTSIGYTVAIGFRALNALSSGAFNTAVGGSALATVTTGGSNVGVGTFVLSNTTTGVNNVGLGVSALDSNVTGSSNVAIGYLALSSNISATNTVAIGANAGKGHVSTSNQGGVYVGANAGLNLDLGADYNTLLGYNAGTSITSGYGNILLGANPDTITQLTTGNSNIGIGYGAGFPSATASNQLNLGSILFGTLPATTTAFTLPTSGAIGIGTSSPFAKFSIATNNGDAATTLFAIGSSTGSATSTLFSISNTGSTTAANGINITAGCFAVNGTCLSSGGSGTVTSVNASGGTTGLSFSGGPVTSSGTLTLAGTLGAANGGTGSTTLSGIIVGNGTAAVNTLILPSFLSLSGNTLSLGTLGVANGGTGSTTLTGLLKGNGTGSLVSAIAGTDYLAPSSLSATYPIQYSGNVFSLAFGTTTANSWSSLQQFNGNSSTTQLTVTGNTYLASAGGKVGIGTTSPNWLLSVSGSSGTRLKTTSDITNAFTVENSVGTSTLQLDTLNNSDSIFSVATSTGSTYLYVAAAGNTGIGTTTPTAQLTTTGTVRFANFGAGSLTTDANGNLSVSSDERLKNINGSFDRGLADIEKLDPILYHWNAVSGLDQQTQYAGFSAQNVQSTIPEAVNTDPRGYLTLQDRPILAASVNAIKELAGRTDALSISTTTLGSRIGGIEAALAAQQAAPVNTSTVNANSITTQSLSINGNAFATSFIAPATPISFTIGSTTGSLPSEILTDTGGVDLYKAATYAITGVQSLQAQTGVLASRLDAVELRVAMLEAAASSTPATGGTLSFAGFQDLLGQIGVIIKDGIAHFTSLAFTNLIASPAADGTSAVATSTIPVGQTQVIVTNSLAHPSSEIFVTITSPLSGSWYISQKAEGSFTISLSSPQATDVTFDYFIVQTEGKAQVASAAAPIQYPAQYPDQTPAGLGASSTPSAASSTPAAGAPTITLNGDAAVDVAQGGFWSDPGASAHDAAGNDLTAQIAVTGSVDTDTAGLYTLNYSVVDASGISAGVSRIVHVSAPTVSAPSDPGTSAPADPSTPAPVISDAPTPPAGG